MDSDRVLFVDGACQPNPGAGSFGVVVERPDGGILRRLSKPLGFTTSNQAEWHGLLAAFDYLITNPCRRATVLMDSQLVVQQVNGQWRVNQPGLKPLAQEGARRLALLRRRGMQVEVRWQPRERNTGRTPCRAWRFGVRRPAERRRCAAKTALLGIVSVGQ